MKYRYELMQLRDAPKRAKVFVPNCTARETLDVFRFFKGYRKDFPAYNEASNVVTGIDEDAWCLPKVYLEAYAPLDMACIVRYKL